MKVYIAKEKRSAIRSYLGILKDFGSGHLELLLKSLVKNV